MLANKHTINFKLDQGSVAAPQSEIDVGLGSMVWGDN